MGADGHSNNPMVLQAIVEALLWLKDPGLARDIKG
jgi:ribonuclease HI